MNTVVDFIIAVLSEFPEPTAIIRYVPFGSVRGNLKSFHATNAPIAALLVPLKGVLLSYPHSW